MIRSTWRGLASTAAGLWLCGCGSYPTPRIYVLGEPSATPAGVSSAVGLPVVELKTVTTPDDVDTTDILRREGANRVIASPTGRWSARVSVALTQALATGLSRRLPQVVIATRSSYEPTRRLLVDVQRFEIAADGRCTLTARWGMSATSGKMQPWSEQGTFVTDKGSPSDADVAAGMSQAADELADRIAITVRLSLTSPTIGTAGGNVTAPSQTP